MSRPEAINNFKGTSTIIDRDDNIVADIDGEPFKEFINTYGYLKDIKTFLFIGEGDPNDTGIDTFDGLNEVYTGSEKDYSDISGIGPPLIPDWSKFVLTGDIIYFDKNGNNFWKTTSRNTGHPSTWTWNNITTDAIIHRPDIYINDGDEYAHFEKSSTGLILKNEVDKLINLRGHKIEYNTLESNVIYKYLFNTNGVILNPKNNEALLSVRNFTNNTGDPNKTSLRWIKYTNSGIWEIRNQDELGTLSVKSINIDGIDFDNTTTNEEYISTTHYNKIIYNQSDLDSLVYENGDTIYFTNGIYNIDIGYLIEGNNITIESNSNSKLLLNDTTGENSGIIIKGSNNKIDINIDCANIALESVICINNDNTTGGEKSNRNKFNINVTNINNIEYLIDDYGFNNNFEINHADFSTGTIYNKPHGIGYEEIGTLEIGYEPSSNGIYKNKIGEQRFYNSILIGQQNNNAVLGTTP